MILRQGCEGRTGGCQGRWGHVAAVLWFGLESARKPCGTGGAAAPRAPCCRPSSLYSHSHPEHPPIKELKADGEGLAARRGFQLAHAVRLPQRPGVEVHPANGTAQGRQTRVASRESRLGGRGRGARRLRVPRVRAEKVPRRQSSRARAQRWLCPRGLDSRVRARGRGGRPRLHERVCHPVQGEGAHRVLLLGLGRARPALRLRSASCRSLNGGATRHRAAGGTASLRHTVLCG